MLNRRTVTQVSSLAKGVEDLYNLVNENKSAIEDLDTDIRSQWKAWDKRMKDIRESLEMSNSPEATTVASLLDRSAMDECLKKMMSATSEVKQAQCETGQMKEDILEMKQQLRVVESVVHGLTPAK
eukprot:evm.model.scf_359.11 EVM.evm.TU.scf_359.11   scf_359:77730-78478(-)